MQSSPTNDDIIWDLTPLASHDGDPVLETDRKQALAAANRFAQKWRSDTNFTSDNITLKVALDEYEQLMRNHGANAREWYYYQMRSAQDQSDATLKGLATKADQAATDVLNLLQFFYLELSRIPADRQPAILSDPLLSPYHHFLEKLFAQSPYVLSEPEEKILNLLTSAAQESWIRMTSEMLARERRRTPDDIGQVEYRNLPEILSLSSSADKHTRDSAARQIHAIMRKWAPIATEEMNALLNFKYTVDTLRGFQRPDQARLLADDIEPVIVDVMLRAVEERFDLAKRYYSLKARLLNVDKLAYHERNVPLGSIERQFDFTEAIELVRAVFDKLDPEFSQILDMLHSNRQFDVFPRPGKVGGAFCAHASLQSPTYVLLNHTGRLNDVLTLAHELGHAINNELMRRTQNAVNFDTPLSTAEVASTFMEDFVLEHIEKNTSPTDRLNLLMTKLNDDVSSIFRQVAAYRFEQSLHAAYAQSRFVNQNEIGRLFRTHMSAYMGDAVQQSPGSENWWVYWSHFRNHFYVYSYASGLLISKSLQALVRQRPENIESVKKFLSTGTSASPRKSFAELGIDITEDSFWQRGIAKVEQDLLEAESLAGAT